MEGVLIKSVPARVEKFLSLQIMLFPSDGYDGKQFVT
jgi:hypothetical protein